MNHSFISALFFISLGYYYSGIFVSSFQAKNQRSISMSYKYLVESFSFCVYQETKTNIYDINYQKMARIQNKTTERERH
jgi:hypothetical protein